jgi:hypothetical protein
MNTEIQNENLEKQRTNLLLEIKIQNAKVCELKTHLEYITKRIQKNCNHDWVTEVQMYEKEVYCSRCGLTDWEKSRF